MLLARGELSRISSGCLLINVQDCIYSLIMIFIHILLYTACILLYNGTDWVQFDHLCKENLSLYTIELY